MKGFIRVFEAIIASIIMIASLTFFFSDSTPPSGWESTTLQVLSQDALQSSYQNGTITRFVKINDKNSLNSYFSQMLPKTVDFSLNVKGIPNDIIRVSCVDCSVGQLSEMEAIFNPLDFEYSNRKISIRTERLDLVMENIREDTDTLFFFDKTKVVQHEAKIRDFLKSGGSVILLSDLAESDVNGPIGSIFNLSWSGRGTSPGTFYDIYDGRNLSHFVAKYYANISGKYLENVQADTFTFYGSNMVALNDKRTIVNSMPVAYVRTNFDIENYDGRSVWFADYIRLNHNTTTTKATDDLLKASLMWASGESYSLDTIKKTPAPVHFKSSIIINDGDTYIFELIVWRAFF